MHQIPDVMVIVTGRLKGKRKTLKPCESIIFEDFQFDLWVSVMKATALIVKGHSIPGEN